MAIVLSNHGATVQLREIARLETLSTGEHHHLVVKSTKQKRKSGRRRDLHPY
jgi:hypothetical protein